MTAGGGARDVDPAGHAAGSDLIAVDVERERWYEFIGLVRVLRPKECMEPGYYRDPTWSIRDLMGHIGTWLAEAQVQLEQINAATYEGHAVDVDGPNERFLGAVRDQSWETVWDLAHAGRTPIRIDRHEICAQGLRRVHLHPFVSLEPFERPRNATGPNGPNGRSA